MYQFSLWQSNSQRKERNRIPNQKSLIEQSYQNVQFMTPRTLIAMCDVYIANYTSNEDILRILSNTKWENGIIIFVSSTSLSYFLRLIPMFPSRFILVTGNSDYTIPTSVIPLSTFYTMLNNPNLIHWFSVNCIVNDHPKVTQVPIGLDYHTIAENKDHSWGAQMSPLEQEQQLKAIRNVSIPLEERQMQCYSNYHFTKYPTVRNDREDAIKYLPRELVFYQPFKTTRENCWKTQTNYVFVPSPHGNGMDCHRTWESLVLGNYVVVKTSPLDPLYCDLPVLIVNDWREVDLPLLEETFRRFRETSFNYDKLTALYWKRLIHSYKSQ